MSKSLLSIVRLTLLGLSLLQISYTWPCSPNYDQGYDSLYTTRVSIDNPVLENGLKVLERKKINPFNVWTDQPKFLIVKPDKLPLTILYKLTSGKNWIDFFDKKLLFQSRLYKGEVYIWLPFMGGWVNIDEADEALKLPHNKTHIRFPLRISPRHSLEHLNGTGKKTFLKGDAHFSYDFHFLLNGKIKKSKIEIVFNGDTDFNFYGIKSIKFSPKVDFFSIKTNKKGFKAVDFKKDFKEEVIILRDITSNKFFSQFNPKGISGELYPARIWKSQERYGNDLNNYEGFYEPNEYPGNHSYSNSIDGQSFAFFESTLLGGSKTWGFENHQIVANEYKEVLRREDGKFSIPVLYKGKISEIKGKISWNKNGGFQTLEDKGGLKCGIELSNIFTPHINFYISPRAKDPILIVRNIIYWVFLVYLLISFMRLSFWHAFFTMFIVYILDIISFSLGRLLFMLVFNFNPYHSNSFISLNIVIGYILLTASFLVCKNLISGTYLLKRKGFSKENFLKLAFLNLIFLLVFTLLDVMVTH